MRIHQYDPSQTDSLPRFTAEQHEIIEAVLKEPTKAFLNGSTMGAGKTAMTAEIIARSGWERVLLVGVKDTAKQWEAAIREQSEGRLHLRHINGTKAGRANLAAMLAGEGGIFFSGSQFLTRQDWTYEDDLNDDGNPIPELDKNGQPTGKNQRTRKRLWTYKKMYPLDALIVDEIHILAGNRKNVGRRTLTSIPTEWRGALSGTFYGNNFQNAWSVTKWLWPDIIDGSFHRWKYEWCQMGEPIYVKRGGKTEEIERIVGENNPGEYVKSLPCYFRIEAEEEVPEPKLVYVNLSQVQREQYRQMEQDMLMWLKERHPDRPDGMLVPLVAEVPIAQRQRLRTATLGEMSLTSDGDVWFSDDCRSTKLDALSGILAHYGKQKVVIYTDSKRFAKVTVRRMLKAGLSVAEWSGDVNSAGRDAIKQAFLRPMDDGGLQYIVAVISAFGTGLDGFQTVCSKIVWLSEVEGDAVQNDQAVHRIWRRGVDRDAFEHVKILARDTYDEGVFSALQAKSSSMKETMRKAG